jgi:imidazolonepropionase-like amidohydrolase
MKVIIKNGKVIDGTCNPPKDKATIVIENEAIKEILQNADSENAEIHRDDIIIDAKNKAIIPGLINAHLHLFLDASNRPLKNLGYEKGSLSLLRSVKRCNKIINQGITAVRDLGAKDYGIISLKEAIDHKIIPGPRIVTCGMAIAMTGGHALSIARTADSSDEIRKIVRESLFEGCDFVKVFATGGFGKIGERLDSYELSTEEIKAAVVTAHAAGKKVAAHAYGNKGIWNSILAGVDSIEHATFLDEKSIREILKRGIFLVPTLSNTYRLIKYGKQHNLHEYMVDLAENIFPEMLDRFKEAYDAGIKLPAGTDGGSWLNPHHDIVTELKLREEAGIPRPELIRMATQIAAECIGLDHQIGSIQTGKKADMVILNADPLQDIENLKEIYCVIKGGEIFRCS